MSHIKIICDGVRFKKGAFIVQTNITYGLV